MNERILTKEEYMENLNNKLNSLIKPAINVAINTKEFKDIGYYSRYFIIDGEKEVRVVMVDNKDWIVLDKETYYHSCTYRNMYYDLEKKCKALEDELAKRKRKKFLGIF